MKKTLFILMIPIALLQGCRMGDVEWGWETKEPRKIQETFSHRVHEKVLQKEGFTCLACHTMEIPVEEESEEKMYEFSRTVFFPGKETCHFCHYNPEAVTAAPRDCGLCHFDLVEIQPANHHFDWKARHAVFSKSNQADCESCHTSKFCEDCHKRRDLPTRRVHDRNFRFVHAIEARVNPRSCGNCHELTSFCSQCHVEGGYER